MTRLVTVAHGTRTTAGNAVAVEITRQAGRRLGLTAVTSYVELCEPLFAEVIAGGETDSVVVPLLLSTGYHMRVDLAAAASGAERTVRLGGPLGPHPLIARAMAERLREAGAAPGGPVVLVAAGSNDADASTDLTRAGDLLADLWGGAVRVATLAGRGRRVGEVVRPGDAVVPYLLAPGLFATRAAQEARTAGAGTVADVLGPHPLLVDLVVDRARSLAAIRR